MATRTLKAKYEAQDAASNITREILNITKDGKDIYYAHEDEVPEALAAAAEAAPAAPSAPTPAAPVAAAAPAAAAAGPAASVPDEPLKATDTLRALIAHGLRKPLADVPLSKAIKDLVGGKSTLQNELLGSAQAEFGSAPDKAEELPLEELGAALNVGYGGTLGKHMSGVVSRMVGSKMPGGFGISGVKGHFSKAWGLGPGRTDGALLVAVTMEPAKRLGSEGEAKAFLDGVAQAYAQQAGISLSQGGGGGGGAAGGGGAVINSEEFEKFQSSQDTFVAQQVEVLLRYLKRDSRDGHRLFDAQKAETATLQEKLDAINREHGDDYVSGIQPVFDSRKARHFDSAWNWVRQTALEMFYDMCALSVLLVARLLILRAASLAA